jgi:DNA-binding CsgD family transcriptional regulator
MAEPVIVGELDAQRHRVKVSATEYRGLAVCHQPGRGHDRGSYEPSRVAGRGSWHEAPSAGSRTHVLPELVETAVRAGEREVAVSALQQLVERTSASHSELELGLLARSRALLAADDEADRLYTDAIKHMERSRSVGELARTHLRYGEWLRRQRRRCDARRELRTAHELFEAIGDEAFARHARVELLATGEHARKRSVATTDELTPQEAQTARLAGEGASNAEIAAQMFLSRHTVCYHLRKVYRKLGIANRTQLARIVHLAQETDNGRPVAG